MKLNHVVSFQLNKNGDNWTEDSRFYYFNDNPLYHPSVKDIQSDFYLTPLCSTLNKHERIYVSSGDSVPSDLEADALYEYITENFKSDFSDRFYMELVHKLTLDNGGNVVLFMDSIYMDKPALDFLESTISEDEFRKIKDELLSKVKKGYYYDERT